MAVDTRNFPQVIDDKAPSGHLDMVASLVKWAIFAFASAYVINHVLDVAPYYMPPTDPDGAMRYLIIRILAALILINSLSLGILQVDWITKYGWFEELRNGNMAVAIVTAAVCIALGLGLAYT